MSVFQDAPRIGTITLYRRPAKDTPECDIGDVRLPAVSEVSPRLRSRFRETLSLLEKALTNKDGKEQTLSNEVVSAAEAVTKVTKLVQEIQEAPRLKVCLTAISDLQNENTLTREFVNKRVKVLREHVPLLKPNDDHIQRALRAVETVSEKLFTSVDLRRRIEEFIRDNLQPRFIYFSNYKMIEGMVKLPDYLVSEKGTLPSALESGERLDKRETIANLFQLAQLDPKYLQSLKGKLAEQNKYLSECSRRLTDTLQATWLGQRIEAMIHYGDDVVSVNIFDMHDDGSRTNDQLLQRRSYGFRWYFSFLINFRAETQRDQLREAILLLDEPGLHLHPIQQAGLLTEMKNLAKTNQILYTTHSPFMLFSYEPGNLLTIETDDKTHLSTVREHFWDGDPRTSIPILHALGAKELVQIAEKELAERLPAILVIEGETDYWYLKTAMTLLRRQLFSALSVTARRTPLSLWEIELSQANSSSAIALKALFLKSQGYRVGALYDNEPDAKNHGETLVQQGFPSSKVLYVSVDGKEESDIEDMFSDTEYIEVVNRLYVDRLRKANYVPVEKKHITAIRRKQSNARRIVKALELLWKEHEGENWGSFDKCDVCQLLCTEALAKGTFKAETMNRFKGLFERIDQSLIVEHIASTPQDEPKETPDSASPDLSETVKPSAK